MDQLKTIATPGRDPRGWVVTVAHMVYLPNFPQTQAGDDAARAQWFDFSIDPETHQLHIVGVPDQLLAFDHADILTKASQVIQESFKAKPKWLNLLPPVFSWQAIETIAEQFSGRKISEQIAHYREMYMFPVDTEKHDDTNEPHAFFRLKEPI